MSDTTNQAPPPVAPSPAEDDEIIVPPRSASRVEEGDGSTRAVLLDLERERKARQKLERDLKKMQEATQSESEKALAAARAEGRTEALSVSNARILRAEVKAAAGGVLQDPNDAVRMLDLDDFEVDEDGEVDAKAIEAAVIRLAKDKPYLAVGAKPSALPGGGAKPSTGQPNNMDDVIRAAARGARQ